jgi:hypothetical protein
MYRTLICLYSRAFQLFASNYNCCLRTDLALHPLARNSSNLLAFEKFIAIVAAEDSSNSVPVR